VNRLFAGTSLGVSDEFDSATAGITTRHIQLVLDAIRL